MPELPEVEALADHLRRHATGRVVTRVDVSALSVLKTSDPPTLSGLHSAIYRCYKPTAPEERVSVGLLGSERGSPPRVRLVLSGGLVNVVAVVWI